MQKDKPNKRTYFARLLLSIAFELQTVFYTHEREENFLLFDFTLTTHLKITLDFPKHQQHVEVQRFRSCELFLRKQTKENQRI